jgi:3-oxoacyl-[acyl-carrier-protein] synthase II
VITGLGPVTPIGVGAEAFLHGQREGKNGIRPITRFDASELSVRIAGEVDVDLGAYIDRKEVKRLDRFVQLALVGTALALEDAGLSEADVAGERTGTCIGSGIGGLGTWEAQSKVRFERTPMRMSPFFIPMMIANMASGQVSMRYGLQGPSSTVVTACATGSGAVGDAYRVIQRGEADVMISGGSEACVTPIGIGGFAVMKALSTRNDSPETASRPFTASRDGFVAGEGAGILVLEELEHAKARGATTYAEVVGYATSADAHHITRPLRAARGPCAVSTGRSSRRSFRRQIGYINAHGTSTPINDLNETLAYKAIFGGKEKVRRCRRRSR